MSMNQEAILNLIREKTPEYVITAKREGIRKEFVTNIGHTLYKLSIADLQRLFSLYDSLFFQGELGRQLQDKLKFSLSGKMTRSAGMTLCSISKKTTKPAISTMEIRIGIDFFTNFDEIQGEKLVCGIKASDYIEALQLVFEHELCHVVEFILFNRSNCKKAPFKEMALHLFNHTAGYHQLPTFRQIAAEKYKLKVGDSVSFQLKGKEMKGILYRIHKRAVVMVQDQKGPFRDLKTGISYTKYYIPLDRLQVKENPL